MTSKYKVIGKVGATHASCIIHVNLRAKNFIKWDEMLAIDWWKHTTITGETQVRNELSLSYQFQLTSVQLIAGVDQTDENTSKVIKADQGSVESY
ncbi:hypothetical protein J6590_061270 [Homalodisca vitripennis]|nr:hypothetical protein J6590_061270 [Homalodisca vitripennis]